MEAFLKFKNTGNILGQELFNLSGTQIVRWQHCNILRTCPEHSNKQHSTNFNFHQFL